MRKQYEAPQSKVINFDVVDVITDNMSKWGGENPDAEPGFGEGDLTSEDEGFN